MPEELERELERALAGMPGPSAEAGERARRSALGALPAAEPTRRRWRGPALLAAAAVAVLAAAVSVTLAATGTPPFSRAPQHHRTRPAPNTRPARATVVLPRGAITFSATVAGRAWLATSSGTSVHGRRLTALAVSPGAVWALEGGESNLRAVAIPGGRTGFVRRVNGTPVAAAWAPAGIRIAYVVHTRGGNRLYDMYGNGRHPFLAAARTTAQAPTWRWDSLAFAYIRADGTVMVHNVLDGRTSAIPPGCGLHRAAAVAFAPFGGLLAIVGTSGRLRIVDTLHHSRGLCQQVAASATPAIAWLRPRQLLVGAGDTIVRYVLGLAGGVDFTAVPGRVVGMAASPGGLRIALALRDDSGAVRIVEAPTPRFSAASRPLRVTRVLLDLGPSAGPVTLAWQ